MTFVNKDVDQRRFNKVLTAFRLRASAGSVDGDILLNKRNKHTVAY